MEEAYPLQWPAGRPRTPVHRRASSAFNVTEATARNHMVHEIQMMRGRNIIISTNKPLRRDGLPYASAKEPDDGGVAVYFQRKDQRVCFSCDQYRKVWENMRAIGKTIEAMRGIERWGSAEMLDRAFTGFTALPAPDHKAPWHEVLKVHRSATTDEIQRAYKDLARKHVGTEYMTDLNVARDDAIKAAAA